MTTKEQKNERIISEIEVKSPVFAKKVSEWMKNCPQIFLTDGFRTKEEQREKFDKKLSKLDGENGISKHQLGLAVDIAFCGDALYPKNITKWQEIAKIAKKCGIDWLKDLEPTTSDWCHFQDDGKNIINNQKMENKKTTTAKKAKRTSEMSVDIESIYLTPDQEQKVENVINHAKVLGFFIPFGEVQIPKGFGTMRIVFEARLARDFLKLYSEKNKVRNYARVITAFDKVYSDEIAQILSGTQKNENHIV